MTIFALAGFGNPTHWWKHRAAELENEANQENELRK